MAPGSPNTRQTYTGALRYLDAWLAGWRLEDATLAGYLGELHEQGRVPVEHVDGGGRAACFARWLPGDRLLAAARPFVAAGPRPRSSRLATNRGPAASSPPRSP